MRIGLFGTGWWARDTTGPGLVAAEDTELVGVWGRNPAKRVALADDLGTRPYDDVDKLLRDIDAVALALPPDVQPDLAVRAARAGKHLLLEKPIALSMADADRVVEAVDDAGVASLVFVTDRLRPAVEAALMSAAERRWDGARVTVFVSGLLPGGVLLESAWRVRHGALWDAGPHTISPLLVTLGPVTEVVALPGPHAMTHAILRHQGGATSTVATTLEAPRPVQTWEVLLHGDNGWLTLPTSPMPAHEAFRGAVAELGHAANSGQRHRCDVHVGRDVVSVLAAVQTSLEEGRAVRPAPSLSR